jgi:hypothetical protein
VSVGIAQGTTHAKIIVPRRGTGCATADDIRCRVSFLTQRQSRSPHRFQTWHSLPFSWMLWDTTSGSDDRASDTAEDPPRIGVVRAGTQNHYRNQGKSITIDPPQQPLTWWRRFHKRYHRHPTDTTASGSYAQSHTGPRDTTETFSWYHRRAMAIREGLARMSDATRMHVEPGP